jgi:hypothetical protein
MPEAPSWQALRSIVFVSSRCRFPPVAPARRCGVDLLAPAPSFSPALLARASSTLRALARLPRGGAEHPEFGAFGARH